MAIRDRKAVNTLFFVLLLCLMLFDWLGYGYYVFYMPFFYLVFHNVQKYIDRTFFVIFLFGVLYSGINVMQTGRAGYQDIFTPIINYPCLYLCGRYLVDNNTEKQLVNAFFMLAFAFALLYILSILKSINEVGFMYMGRNIQIIGFNSMEDLAATGIYSRLVLMSAFLTYVIVTLPICRKLIFTGLSALSVFCGLRLQSRTMLVILLLTFVFLIMVNFKTIIKTQKRNLLLGLFVVVFACIYTYVNFSDELGVIERMQDDSETGIATGGGREQLLLAVLSQMPSHPFGGLSSMRYAHNLWIDCARVSGWIPLLLLVVITIRCIKTTKTILKSRLTNYDFRYFVGMSSFVFLVYFCTEPILEGSALLFAFFCIYLGCIEGKRKQLDRKMKHLR